MPLDWDYPELVSGSESQFCSFDTSWVTGQKFDKDINVKYYIQYFASMWAILKIKHC